MTCLNSTLLRCRQSTMPPHRLTPPPCRLKIHSVSLCWKWMRQYTSPSWLDCNRLEFHQREPVYIESLLTGYILYVFESSPILVLTVLIMLLKSHIAPAKFCCRQDKVQNNVWYQKETFHFLLKNECKSANSRIHRQIHDSHVCHVSEMGRVLNLYSNEYCELTFGFS